MEAGLTANETRRAHKYLFFVFQNAAILREYEIPNERISDGYSQPATEKDIKPLIRQYKAVEIKLAINILMINFNIFYC
jgi:hypothetical protein